MSEIVLFHHVQGLTSGMTAFADDLRAAGHTVHTPDVFEGRTFETLEEGMAHAQSVGFDELLTRGISAGEALPAEVVNVGFSLGVMPAQKLTQTRPGALGAILFDGAIPVTGEWAFGAWPAGVPVQIHGMDADPIFAGEGDVDAARELVEVVGGGAELFLYPGDQHLFADSSLSSYRPEAASLATERVLGFLAALDA